MLAFFIGITTFFNRNEFRFKLQLSIYTVVMGIHFFLMGANSAAGSAMLNAIRTLVSMRTRSIYVMGLFIVLTLIVGLSQLQHPIELLPISGTVASTWALFRTQGLTTRCIMWCSTLCWTIHNLWIGSLGGSLIEGSFLVMNGIAIIRFRLMIKRGIDPFKAEKQS